MTLSLKVETTQWGVLFLVQVILDVGFVPLLAYPFLPLLVGLARTDGLASRHALAILRPMADKEDSLGHEPQGIPTREMVAEILFMAKRPDQALAEYETDLKFNPNRFNGLYGAAQAAEAAGKREKAAQYYAELLKVCAGSNSDRPELNRAKSLVARK